MSRLMLRRADHRARGQRFVVFGTRLQGDVYRFYLAIGIQRVIEFFRPKPECVAQPKCRPSGKILKLVISRPPISDWQICMRKKPSREWCFEDLAVPIFNCVILLSTTPEVSKIICAIKRDSGNFFTAKRMRIKCQR